MVNDPIGDFLIRLQNASRVRKDSVILPHSNMKEAIASVLEKAGYLGEVSHKKAMHTFSVALKYREDGRPAIIGARRISKPSRRMYMGVRDVRPVKNGHGLVVLSTPKGIMTGSQARKERVGGEVLFEIW